MEVGEAFLDLKFPNEIDKMIEIVEGFGREWGRLPGVFKE